MPTRLVNYATDHRHQLGTADWTRTEKQVVPNDVQPERLLSTEETADVLAVSVRTVKNLMSEGKLAYVKIGRATRINRTDIDEYIMRSRHKHRQPLRAAN